MVNEGEVEVTLAGKTVVLRSTLRAAKTIDGKFGGFQNAFARLAAFNMEAYSIVAGAGLGKNPIDVEDDVYQTGMAELIGPLSEYVTLLMNGGRKPGKEGDEKGEG